MPKYRANLEVCDRCDRLAAELFEDGSEMICPNCAESAGRPICTICERPDDDLAPTDEGDLCPVCRADAADRAAWRAVDDLLDERQDRERYESQDDR